MMKGEWVVCVCKHNNNMFSYPNFYRQAYFDLRKNKMYSNWKWFKNDYENRYARDLK